MMEQVSKYSRVGVIGLYRVGGISNTTIYKALYIEFIPKKL
jgi:hypothetical protein